MGAECGLVESVIVTSDNRDTSDTRGRQLNMSPPLGLLQCTQFQFGYKTKRQNLYRRHSVSHHVLYKLKAASSRRRGGTEIRESMEFEEGKMK
jgi:hypothetical protein